MEGASADLTHDALVALDRIEKALPLLSRAELQPEFVAVLRALGRLVEYEQESA